MIMFQSIFGLIADFYKVDENTALWIGQGYQFSAKNRSSTLDGLKNTLIVTLASLS